MKRSSLVIIACVGALAIVTAAVAMHMRRNPAAATAPINPRSNNPPIVASSSAASALPPANVDFDQLMLKIAGEYKQYGRVDRNLHNAPQLCAPPPGPPTYDAISQSKDKASHGRKLYTLFASDVSSYWSLGTSWGSKDGGAVGQTIIKESWTAVPMDQSSPRAHSDLAPVTYQGITYQAGEQRDLFIMTRLPPSTPGTDDGWIYGTVTPDGKTVTSVGRVANCMKCHEDAPHGRLFGLRVASAQ